MTGSARPDAHAGGEFSREERVPRQLAAERLADIAYALAGGETLELRYGGEQVRVPVADEVLLVRRSTSTGDRVEVDVTLSWSSPRPAAPPDPAESHDGVARAAVRDRISLTRVFDASRERVWREWTERERFPHRFGDAESEVRLSSVTMDVRVGGAWRLTTLTPDGEIFWHGDYREVVEPKRIVFTLSDQPGRDAAHALVTVDLGELADGGTEMRFEQDGSLSPDQARAARYGWSRFFDRIADGLAAS